ncbi:MAG: sugar phosphate isomerase/epimerase [Deltaproteobacteria bacterium]|nr:MAG: sugar phosphate isomerase/epimerase [Deltaproteobacteria bacterium]
MESKTIHINVPYFMLEEFLNAPFLKDIAPEIYFSGDDLDRLKQSDIDKLENRLKQRDKKITMHAPFYDLSPGSADKKIREVTYDRFLSVLNIAKILKPAVLVAHPGYDPWRFDGSDDFWLNNSYETWHSIVKEAERYDITIAIENVFEPYPSTLLSLINKINSDNFKFCFDTGHFNIFSKARLKDWFKALGDKLIECHLHDNHGASDEHLPIGYGIFPWEFLIKWLSSNNKEVIFTLEPHKVEDVKEAIEKAYQLLNKIERFSEKG